jgi:hypothetical protein
MDLPAGESISFTVNNAPNERHWIQLFLRAVRSTTEEDPVPLREHKSTLDTASNTVLTHPWFESTALKRKCFPSLDYS